MRQKKLACSYRLMSEYYTTSAVYQQDSTISFMMKNM